jgi:sugar O-acyltransferase (sialic acid O-acetyltransferase NeuD family)
MKKIKLILFGTGDIAEIAADYFEADNRYELVAFVVDGDYLNGQSFFRNKPLWAFEKIENLYSPSEYQLFIALSYANMNRLRESKFNEAKAKGYTLASYISPYCTYLSKFAPGENCFIFEDNTIQPYVKIGDNVTLWSGNHIGHHSTIESHNFISSHVVVSGHCHIESHCFVGVNVSIAHQVRLADGSLIGAGSVISKNTEVNSVYVPARSVKLEKTSDQIKL